MAKQTALKGAPTFDDPQLPAELYVSREFDGEDSYLLTHDSAVEAPDKGELIGVYKLVKTGKVERSTTMKFNTRKTKRK